MDLKSITAHLPPEFWFKTGIFLVIVLVLVLGWRAYQKANKIYLAIMVAVVSAVIFFNWVYNRTEPAWLTPVVDKLANFFPTKDYVKPEAGNVK